MASQDEKDEESARGVTILKISRITFAKEVQLLAAARRNDIQTLKDLLDSPKWYKVRDENGFNLLQIAIAEKHFELFDYLLSLDDFPLEAVDNKGSTALTLALSYFRNDDTFTTFHRACYAQDLIEKGANIDVIGDEGNTLLHWALAMNCIAVAELLIERGADLNAQNARGDTPLHMCTKCRGERMIDAAVTMLLRYGADPSICNYEGYTPLELFLAVKTNVLEAQENLLYFTIDEWSSCEISADVLLTLAKNESPLFHQLVQYLNLFFVYNSSRFTDLQLCTIGEEYLRILLEKCPQLMKKLFLCSDVESPTGFVLYNLLESLDLRNLDILINSCIRPDVIEFISRMNSSNFILNLQFLEFRFRVTSHNSGLEKYKIIEVLYYFLSYGMTLHEKDFQTIYNFTNGYNQDFKNFLFMDVEKRTSQEITAFMPRLLCDVTLDIHEIVQTPSACDFIDWEEIFDYFAHPKIQNAHYVIKNCEITGRELPRIPLLQELARDAFRKYFIKRFKITTTKRFYSLIHSLQICSAHKKILTFESKLY